MGSKLIGQKFDSQEYFWSRPSVNNYNPLPSGASNLGISNPLLINTIAQREKDFLTANKMNEDLNIPPEMVTASASGLDPHISPEAALLQVARVARARGMDKAGQDNLVALINELTEERQYSFFGEPRINVFLLNLKTDSLKMNDYDKIRPDPDELLASIKLEEGQDKRGKLKIFFGMCAGVGKTYSMLESAHIDKSNGKDVVIGYIETHNRPDTNELVKGFEIIPRKAVEYKGTKLEDLDTEAIIARRPDIVLIDELAHTNVPGSSHVKRYEDVLDILDIGIDVYTTLNVQHLESRTDTVSQITGIVVRETVPDEIFEKADEVELVDITPDELLQRFADGKVYTSERSVEAIRNFFKKGNITALREMSLRIVADRVDMQLRAYMQKNRIKGPWKSGMRLLVVIGPSPHSAKLLRWAKSLAYTMGATLLSLYVESTRKLSPSQQDQLNKNINLARHLGIEFITTSGNDIVRSILYIGQKENITHIIVGKPRQWNLISYFRLGNFVNRLIKYSGNIDVYVMGADQDEDSQYMKYFALPSFTSGFSQYFLAALFTILTAAVFYPLKEFIGYQIVAFGLLFTVSILALFVGIGPILLSAALSALIWDFFFIPPSFALHVDKLEDVLMLIMYFIIALIGGIMTSRVRKQERLTRERELRTNALYQLTRELSMTSGIDEVIKTSVNYIRKYSRLESSIILQSGNNVLGKAVRPKNSLTPFRF